ncbi:MAG TPA: PH domain-containing protein [Segeticoccus sp.]|uniref:PH domain-containing protein n=1 Tax=Segeticoccus sp. TaxID=2706531 RepID=UPI002D7F8879|nr:PH domain-containing protein [Segeticoccus sp.]HET8601838.1 PH domain-containing protein [Segeticoccus sp.]
MRAQAALADRRVLRRYLLDGEHVITAVHQHWGKVAEPVLTALAALVVVLWLDTVMPGNLGLIVSVLWWAWLAVVARMVWRLLEWRHDWFVATDKRLLLTYGLITQKVAMMPLKKVTDMTYNRSPLGRLLGYGTFVMESAGQDQALHHINFIPRPDHTYRSICAEIFGVEDHDRVDTEPFEEDDRFGHGSGMPGAGWAARADDVPGQGRSNEWRAREWHSTEEAHRSIGQDPSQPIPLRREHPGRSLYRSPDPDSGRSRHRDEDETGPLPQPPWPPDEDL